MYLIIVRSPAVIKVQLLGQVSDAMRGPDPRPHPGQAPALLLSHPSAGKGLRVLRSSSSSIRPPHPAPHLSIRRAQQRLSRHRTRPLHRRGHWAADGHLRCGAGEGVPAAGGRACSDPAAGSGFPGPKGRSGCGDSEGGAGGGGVRTHLLRPRAGVVGKLGHPAGQRGWPGPAPDARDWLSSKKNYPIKRVAGSPPLHHQPMGSKAWPSSSPGRLLCRFSWWLSRWAPEPHVLNAF